MVAVDLWEMGVHDLPSTGREESSCEDRGAMRVSVVTATCRRGYLPLVAKGLANQTLGDWEWIVVDDNPMANETDIAEIRERLKGHLIMHTEPQSRVDHYAPAGARNTGFQMASGEVVLYCNDYVIPGPYALERHYVSCRLHGPKALVSGHLVRPSPPILCTLSPDRIRVDSGWAPRWEGNEVLPEARIREANLDGRIGLSTWRMRSPTDWWAGRSDSIPRETGRAICEGHREHPGDLWEGTGPENEVFDGGWGYPDQQLAQECVEILGCEMVFDTEAVCMEIPHPRGMGKPRIRMDQEQQDLARRVAEERGGLLSMTGDSPRPPGGSRPGGAKNR